MCVQYGFTYLIFHFKSRSTLVTRPLVTLLANFGRLMIPRLPWVILPLSSFFIDIYISIPLLGDVVLMVGDRPWTQSLDYEGLSFIVGNASQ